MNCLSSPLPGLNPFLSSRALFLSLLPELSILPSCRAWLVSSVPGLCLLAFFQGSSPFTFSRAHLLFSFSRTQLLYPVPVLGSFALFMASVMASFCFASALILSSLSCLTSLLLSRDTALFSISRTRVSSPLPGVGSFNLFQTSASFYPSWNGIPSLVCAIYSLLVTPYSVLFSFHILWSWVLFPLFVLSFFFPFSGISSFRFFQGLDGFKFFCPSSFLFFF